MKTTLLAAALAVLAGQANALSCMRPDPIDTFKRVAEAPDTYYVLHGRLSFDEQELPPGVSQSAGPAPNAIAANFRGKGLTRQGFTSNYVRPVTLQPSCAGPWCGSANADVDAVYFVRADGSDIIVQADPCGGFIFENPTRDTLNMLTSCISGGACQSTQSLQ